MSKKEEKSCFSLKNLSIYERKFLKYNIISKIFCYIIFTSVHLFIKDQHDFENMTEFFFNSKPKNPKSKLLYFLMGFAKWDGLMFLKIFHQGYDNLKLHAFFLDFLLY